MKANSVIHLKGLNGIRAIAAISVLISHVSLELNGFGLNALFTDVNGSAKGILMASYGVTIFFALSGFLITFLLLKEKEKFKKIDFKKFYIRRFLRIWPLYYLYIILGLIIYFLFAIKTDISSVSLYILFLGNIAIISNMMLPFMGHLWSVAVEEQFYLFWPWLIKQKNILLYKILLFFIFSFWIIKVLIYFFFKDNNSLSIVFEFMTSSRFHTMAIGGLAGLFYYNNHSIIQIFTSKTVQYFSWLIIFLSFLNIFQISSSFVDHEIIALVTVCIILGQITRRNYLIDLDTKFLDFTGKISFGLYVYHPMVIFLLQKMISPFKESNVISYISIYFLVTLISIIISYFSYNFFEIKFIKLKNKFTKIKSQA